MELSKKERIALLTNAIVAAHKGRAAFNTTETAKIIHKDYKFVGHEFDLHGILAVRQGNTKYYTADAIAEYLHRNQVSPLSTCREGG